jgi:hypothetical protein
MNEKAKQFVDGRWWYAARAACPYLGVTYRTLSELWNPQCPWLDGQGIETRLLADALERLTTYYAKDDLDRIKAAMANRRPIPNVPGFTHINDAAIQFGRTAGWVRQRMKEKRVKLKKAPGKDKRGRTTQCSYLPNWFVDECKRDRLGDPKPSGKLTFTEAANILGLCKSAVQKMVARKVLRGRPGKALDSAGAVRATAILLDRAEVEALHAKRRGYGAISPTANGATEAREPEEQPRPKRPKRRGRSKGHTHEWKDRRDAMLKDWDAELFGDNKAAAARAYGFHRPDASKIIKEHEQRKRRNNSPA